MEEERRGSWAGAPAGSGDTCPTGGPGSPGAGPGAAGRSRAFAGGGRGCASAGAAPLREPAPSPAAALAAQVVDDRRSPCPHPGWPRPSVAPLVGSGAGEAPLLRGAHAAPVPALGAGRGRFAEDASRSRGLATPAPASRKMAAGEGPAAAQPGAAGRGAGPERRGGRRAAGVIRGGRRERRRLGTGRWHRGRRGTGRGRGDEGSRGPAGDRDPQGWDGRGQGEEVPGKRSRCLGRTEEAPPNCVPAPGPRSHSWLPCTLPRWR